MTHWLKEREPTASAAAVPEPEDSNHEFLTVPEYIASDSTESYSDGAWEAAMARVQHVKERAPFMGEVKLMDGRKQLRVEDSCSDSEPPAELRELSVAAAPRCGEL